MKERSVPIRLGIAEYLLRGDVSVFEFGVYVIVHLQADYCHGIWRGSAPRILNSAPRGAKLREVQRALEHLTGLGLLKPFHKHGQRGNFPFLINKFTVRCGALKGMRLNADKSESWRHPKYEPCADVDADDDAHGRAQGAPIQEVRSKREEMRKKPTSKAAAPADPRFKPVLDFAFEAFAQKHGQKPTWGARDFKALSAMLASNRSLDAAELERRFRNYLGSTDPFTQKQGGSLAYFSAHVDSFLVGPILEPQKGGQNKEDNAVHSSAAAFWKALGVNPETLPASFRRHTEAFYERRENQTTVELAGAVMDGWTVLGNRIPAPFAKATSALRRLGSAADDSNVPILEVEPWAR